MVKNEYIYSQTMPRLKEKIEEKLFFYRGGENGKHFKKYFGGGR